MDVAWVWQLSSPNKMPQVGLSRVVQIKLTKRTELKKSHFVSPLKYSKGDHDIMDVGQYQHTQRTQALLPGGLAIRVFLGLNHQQGLWWWLRAQRQYVAHTVGLTDILALRGYQQCQQISAMHPTCW